MTEKQKKEQLVAIRNGELTVENSYEYWTENDIKKLIKMFNSGYGVSEIALTLKRTEVSVVCNLQNRGLFAKQCKPRAKTSKVDKTSCLCKQCRVTNCDKRDSNKGECQDYKESDS